MQRLLLFAVALAVSAPSVQAQTGVQDGRWTVYGGDPGHTRYSGLDQIDASNAADLDIAWRWTARNFGYNPRIAGATTPLYVDGVLYATAGVRRSVVAIDAGTGETLWTWRMDEGERLRTAPRDGSGRGVAYWETPDGHGRVLVVTPGYHMVALDAKSGRPVVGFGEGGVVDLMRDHRVREGVDIVGTIGASSPPTVVGDVIVVGSAHHVGYQPPSRTNTPGDVRGFDARTGELLWTFHTIPEPGEPGNETWLEDSWSYTGNAGVWAPMSFDAETGYVYLPTEAATGDFYGGHRPGDNLYSTSLVCLDGRSGEVVWHFQTVHHDIWDLDNPAAPILADVEIEGVTRKIVVQLTKQGLIFVFDRVTGEPIWPIEERPVPQTDVPGERTSPTQPFPTKPEPVGFRGITEDDLLDFTPEVKTRALEIAGRFRLGPLYTPPSLADAPDGTRGTIMYPYTTGGPNWEGGAFDPGSGLLFVGSRTVPGTVLGLFSDEARSDMRYVNQFRTAQLGRGIPIVKPPWGTITAIDLSTGEHAWEVLNGETPSWVPRALGVAPEAVPNTGQISRAMLLATSTLVFATEGVAGGPVMRALDKSTGRTIAEIELPNASTGLPMTYLHEGRQYVVVTVGGGGEPSELVALALPSGDG